MRFAFVGLIYDNFGIYNSKTDCFRNIQTPHSLPMFKQQKSTRRAREKAKSDPTRAAIPVAPQIGPGTGTTLHVVVKFRFHFVSSRFFLSFFLSFFFFFWFWNWFLVSVGFGFGLEFGFVISFGLVSVSFPFRI
jgi:hypothetical protein